MYLENIFTGPTIPNNDINYVWGVEYTPDDGQNVIQRRSASGHTPDVAFVYVHSIYAAMRQAATILIPAARVLWPGTLTYDPLLSFILVKRVCTSVYLSAFCES